MRKKRPRWKPDRTYSRHLSRPLSIFRLSFPVTSARYAPITFTVGWTSRPAGAIGKPVHALADGHISRIRVTHGSGYVLDVDYDNGYSTINRHLSAFVGDIARRVKDLQYEQESWEVEIIPEPGNIR